jgi:NADH:ubiquinone oxidoreductase subunit 6 (subunit J)
MKTAVIVIVGVGTVSVLVLFVIMRRKLEQQMRREQRRDGR